MRLISVLAGNGTAALLGLARNLLAATLLSLTDYGLAATFFIIISLAEMLTQFGQSALIIADRDGGHDTALARYHGFNILRGLLAAVGIATGALIFAPADGRMMFVALALVPLFGAVQHFRQFQLQRDGQVRVAAVIPAVSALLSVVALLGLAQIITDARAVLGAVIAQALTAFLLSHVLSDVPYQITVRRADLTRDFRMGLPLLANGILLFLVLFGERLIVGRVLGLEALGVFAMGVTLTLTPSIILSKSLMTHYLPRFAQDGAMAGFAVMKAHALAGFAIALSIAIAGPIFIRVFLPVSFAPLGLLLPLMALQQGLRLAKAGQAVVGIGLGFRADELWVSMLRIAFLPVAFALVMSGYGLITLLWIAVLAEGVGLALAIALVRHRCANYGAP